MIKFYCDRCSEEVFSKEKFHQLSITKNSKSEYEQDYETKDIDGIEEICTNCTRNIVSFISNPLAFCNQNNAGIKEKNTPLLERLKKND